jgi:hypothetical protein
MSSVSTPPAERQGDWMLTYSGKRFWPIDPRPEDVRIEDIAHQLSLANRFAGATRWPYSVAQHSVLCARAAFWFYDDLVKQDKGAVLAVLLHDASEAYVQDIVRPAKRFIQGYDGVEDRLMRVIATRFGFAYPFVPLVHEIDNRMLVTEAPALMSGEAEDWWLDPKWPAPFRIDIEPWLPQYAEHAFLEMFERLSPTTH